MFDRFDEPERVEGKPTLFYKPKETDADLPERTRQRQGPDYIPGYAERVMANNLSTSLVLTTAVKEKYYEREFGVGPGEIPVEFVWVRVSGPNGEDSYSATQDLHEYVKRGFEAVTVSDKDDFVKQYEFAGVKGFPPAAHVGSDGMVRHRDSALYVVSRVRADKLEQERIEDNKRLLGHNQPGGEVAPSPYDFNEEEIITRQLGQQT